MPPNKGTFESPVVVRLKYRRSFRVDNLELVKQATDHLKSHIMLSNGKFHVGLLATPGSHIQCFSTNLHPSVVDDVSWT